MKLFKTTLIASALVAAGFVGNASAATTTGNFQAKIVITESCTFGTNTNVDFGSMDLTSTANAENSGSLSVTCTSGTPYTIALNAGSYTGATVTTRRMSSGSNSIPYALYRNSGRTENWGNTGASDTVPGIGTGAAQTISVYGRVKFQDVNVPAGSYTDTITATITY